MLWVYRRGRIFGYGIHFSTSHRIPTSSITYRLYLRLPPTPHNHAQYMLKQNQILLAFFQCFSYSPSMHFNRAQYPRYCTPLVPSIRNPKEKNNASIVSKKVVIAYPPPAPPQQPYPSASPSLPLPFGIESSAADSGYQSLQTCSLPSLSSSLISQRRN